MIRPREGPPFPAFLKTSAIANPAGRTVGARWLINDASERKLAQDAARQREQRAGKSQRDEALGRVAIGSAEELAGVLTVISGEAELLMRQLDPGHPAAIALERILGASERGTDRIAPILALGDSRRHPAHAVDLNALIRSLEWMLRRLLGSEMELRFDLAAGLPVVWVDEVQLARLIAELTLYARKAMPPGGQLAIETSRVASMDRIEGWAPGAATPIPPIPISPPPVRLTVTARGAGVDPAAIAALLGPYRTASTALEGAPPDPLAPVREPAAYGIIQRFGGQIGVSSEPGRGTTFTLCLPLDERRDGTPVRGPRALEPERPPGVVVLAMQDQALRCFVAELLRSEGHTVIEAPENMSLEVLAQAGLVIADRRADADRVLARCRTNGQASGSGRAIHLLDLSPPSEHVAPPELSTGNGALVLAKPFRASTFLSHVSELMAR